MKLNGLGLPDLRLMTRHTSRSFLREGRNVLSLEAELPEVNGASPMNAYYRRLFRQLAGFCDRELIPALPKEQPPLRLHLDYRVTLLTPELLSLSLELHRQEVRPIPAARFAAVWSRSSGVPLPLRAFFPNPLGTRRKLREWLREEALGRLRSGYCLYDPEQAERAGKLFSPRNFYAAEKGLVLFFPPLTLGSAAEGIPEFCLPWDEAGPCMPHN